MDLKRGNKLVSKKKLFSYLFYIDKKSINIENDKRKINERQKRRAAAREITRIRSSEASRVVTQKGTSVE